MASTSTPSFSTGTGTYHAPPTVKISDSTTGAVIHYTTNGSTPTASSTVYSAPLTISSTTTLQAIAVSSGTSSAVASATYTISPALTPGFSTGTGTYHAPPTVTVSDGTSGAVIYYTTNGATPTNSSSVYTAPLKITSTTTLKAIAIYPGGPASAVDSATYTLAAAITPTFSTGTGTYYCPPTVKISEGTSGAVIYYTTNGSTPTTSSSVYSSPLTLTSTTTLKAMAVYPGGTASGMDSATYTMAPAYMPVLSVASGTFGRSVTVSLKEATSGAVIHYTTNGSTPTTSSAVYSGPLTFTNSSTFTSATTLKAVAIYPNGWPSPTATATYTILSLDTPVATANSNSTFMGISAAGLLGETPWPLVPVGSLRLMGAQTNWADLNPLPGVYQFVTLDAQIDLARANGAQLMYTFVATPAWAIPTNLQISSITRSNNVVTVTTAQPHQLYYNSLYAPTDATELNDPAYSANHQSSVTIAGVANSSFDGTFVLSGTPTSTTFTFAQTGSNSTSSEGRASAVCGGTWAPAGCAEQPQNLENWQQYVTALVNHVGPGVIKYWELWNEANISETWRGDPKTLVTMAAEAKSIIKSVDPNAQILSPSATINFETPTECATYDPRCGSKFIGNWLAAGGSSSVDGIAFHGYPTVGEAPEQIQGQVSMIQLAMNQNGVGSLPIIDTESSWGLNTLLPNPYDQVWFLGRHLLLEHSMGVQRSFWYSYDSSLWGTLWNLTDGLNQVGVADQQVANWIDGATVTVPCAPTAADPTTFTCSYSKANRYAAVAVWNTAGDKSFTVPATLKQYRDLYGNVVPVTNGTVPISTSPILVETFSAPE